MRSPVADGFWSKSSRARAQIVRRVCERLEAEYGCPRLGNPIRPLDDLFYVIISNRTAPATAVATYRALRRWYRRWEALADAPLVEIEAVLRPAGLSAKKAAQIGGIARRLRSDLGSVTLSPLRGRSDDNVLAYMRTLPGVSTKVAYCVMMYTMGRKVLPVDVHVHRVCGRLGWVAKKRADQSHEVLTALVPAHRRFAFHVDCILLGRKVCTPTEPNHAGCSIRGYCDYAWRQERGESP
jgi:endonuclease III